MIELIQNIHAHAAPPPEPARKPIADPAKVAMIVKITSLVGLTLSVVFLSLSIWGVTTLEFALRILATICVVVTAMHIFRAINNED